MCQSPPSALAQSPIHTHLPYAQTAHHTFHEPSRRSAGWDYVRHEFHVSDHTPDYAHADPCRQEKRSVYIFDLFVSRDSAPDLTTKLAQLPFKASAAPAHLTEVSVGVFFEQASSPPISAPTQSPPITHPSPRRTITSPHTATKPAYLPRPYTSRCAQSMTSCTSLLPSSTLSTAGR